MTTLCMPGAQVTSSAKKVAWQVGSEAMLSSTPAAKNTTYTTGLNMKEKCICLPHQQYGMGFVLCQVSRTYLGFGMLQKQHHRLSNSVDTNNSGLSAI